MARKQIVDRPKAQGQPASAIVNLPPEVQSMIAGFVPRFVDLCSLCRTCQAWKVLVLPRIYSCVELYVPLRCNEYPRLENLLSSSGEGLKLTKSVIVRVAYEHWEEDEVEHDSTWTDMLNTLIRVLVRKIPTGTLEEFIWIHPYELKNTTLDTLSTCHGASLRRLELGTHHSRNGSKMDNVSNLNTLCVPSLLFESEPGPLLIASLIANNHKTLRHLDLGAEGSLIDCRDRNEPHTGTGAAQRLREGIIAEFKHDKTVYLPKVDSLRLRGLDSSVMMSGEQHRLINFASLKHLVLESCSAICNSLQKLTSLSLQGLQTFHIRQEDYQNGFLEALENFLCILPPLTALSILLHGSFPDVLEIEQIMEVHAPSLRTCIMDFRYDDRIATVDSREGWRQQYSVDIIELCPNLVELGISVDWETLDLGGTDSLLFLGKIRSCLPKLRTLNIRNMPEACLIPHIPTNAQVKGIALYWIDQMIAAGLSDGVHGSNDSGKGLPPPINILAFGSLRHPDVWSDRSTSLDDFTTLRTFAVDYCKTSMGEFAPVLSQVTWGPPCGILDKYEDISILQPYWLD